MSVILAAVYSVLSNSFAPTFLVGLVVFIFVRAYLEDKNAGKRSFAKQVNHIEDECSKGEKQQQITKSVEPSCQTKDNSTCEDALNNDSCCRSKNVDSCSNSTSQPRTAARVGILYGSTTGTARRFAFSLGDTLTTRHGSDRDGGVSVTLKDCAEFGKAIEEEFQAFAKEQQLVVLLMSTYTDGTPPTSCSWFYNWLVDYAADFRVQHSVFKDLNFCVFGLGNSLYAENFNVVGRRLDKCLHQLSAKRFLSLGLGDENVSDSKNGSLELDFKVWSENLVNKIISEKPGIEVPGTNSIQVNGDCNIDNENDDEDDDDSEATDGEEDEGLVDMEDLGVVMAKAKTSTIKTGQPKEMVTPQLRKSLTKQGYKIIGSHSGVKLCRWTKAMLRGRGGCYKHTFYGIESHRCMETTPSLACANKCVFCWRHHSNPVGTEWRWQMDDAETIIQGALDNHYKMINEFKGVPGVLPDKLAEGMQAQHCALSLVGEPIMYPQINKFVKLLHQKGISSFLVTNAQFPDAIKQMSPCTQLYVSIDASTKDSLKKIDRPLFKDFWERFIQSLKELSAKGQRTVYRLTLVKGWNAEEMDNYAALVALGQPDFIEIKGVTFCGSSKASTLTMENVPWHEEVVYFVKQLVERLSDYSIACEHEHSNCLLVAHKKFKVEGKWMTWIDYARFHELVQRYYLTDGAETFTGLDYMKETPNWAVFGSEERGFDPLETRWRRKGKLEANVDGGCG